MRVFLYFPSRRTKEMTAEIPCAIKVAKQLFTPVAELYHKHQIQENIQQG